MADYKQATKLRLRFDTEKGVLSIEQLWDLNRAQLSRTIRSVKETIIEQDDDDLAFLEDSSRTVDSIDKLKFEILKDIYITKKEEAEDLINARKRKEHNERIMTLIQEKKEGQLKDKSVEELEAMLQ
jgi:hypothetical protein